MPPQARIGDASQVPADVHGCPGCPHTVVGPAISGSPNVFTNGRPSVRVGDKGIHAACCGPNTWAAKTGCRSVLINGRSAHRLSDVVKHCGGMGRTMVGSANVIVGDNTSGASRVSSPPAQTHVGFRIKDKFSGEPIVNLRLTIEFPDGSQREFVTNSKGEIVIHDCQPGSYVINGAEDTSLLVLSSSETPM